MNLTGVVLSILLGLASRRYPSVFSTYFGKYPGDSLWAMMVFFGWGIVLYRASTLNVAVVALITCFVVEALKLYQAPAIVDVRNTTFGHLVFGSIFSVENLFAYAIGVAVALCLEVLLLPRGISGKSIRT